MTTNEGPKEKREKFIVGSHITMVSSSGGLGDVGHCKRNRNFKRKLQMGLAQLYKAKS